MKNVNLNQKRHHFRFYCVSTGGSRGWDRGPWPPPSVRRNFMLCKKKPILWQICQLLRLCKCKKAFSFRKASPPDFPRQGLCPWNPLGTLPQTPRYRFLFGAHNVALNSERGPPVCVKGADWHRNSGHANCRYGQDVIVGAAAPSPLSS